MELHKPLYFIFSWCLNSNQGQRQVSRSFDNTSCPSYSGCVFQNLFHIMYFKGEFLGRLCRSKMYCTKYSQYHPVECDSRFMSQVIPSILFYMSEEGRDYNLLFLRSTGGHRLLTGLIQTTVGIVILFFWGWSDRLWGSVTFCEGRGGVKDEDGREVWMRAWVKGEGRRLRGAPLHSFNLCTLQSHLALWYVELHQYCILSTYRETIQNAISRCASPWP